MQIALNSDSDTSHQLRSLPTWAMASRGQSAEQCSFFYGAAMALLDRALHSSISGSSTDIWRDRMALEAARVCLRSTGRIETIATIRDAVCLAHQTDALGPAGEMFAYWRKGARINLNTSGWKERVRAILPDTFETDPPVLAEGGGSAEALHLLSDRLRDFPENEAAALLLADIALARSMGWPRVIPLFATSLSAADLRALAAKAPDARVRAHRSLIVGCDKALRLLADLSRRTQRLTQAAGKLRTKGAPQALAVFLSHDAVSPSGMLSPIIKGSRIAMTDRAARRLCDRMVELGVVRELTGRSSFRLYGI